MIQRYLILILLIFSHLSVIAEGFLAGTLVKTPYGYTDIEKLAIGDQVVCYNFQGECVTRAVTHVHQQEVQSYVNISVGGQFIYTDLDHKFYLPNDNAWVQAHTIQPGNVFLKECVDTSVVESVRIIDNAATVYNISVDEFHNYCVTTEDICVHNAVPFVAALTLNLFFDGTFAITGMVGIGAAIGKVVIDFFGNGAIGRTVQLDFDVDKFGQGFNNPNNYHAASKEDKKGDKPAKSGDKKPTAPSTKPSTRPLPGQQPKPQRPTASDGFKPPKHSDNDEKERHPKTGQYGWKDKNGNYWIPANNHAGGHYDKVDRNGNYINVNPGGKTRGGNK